MGRMDWLWLRSGARLLLVRKVWFLGIVDVRLEAVFVFRCSDQFIFKCNGNFIE
jgi:hypothetical protein